jgi:hypothetical protein
MSSVAAYIEHPAGRRTGLRLRGMPADGAASMQPMAADGRAQGRRGGPEREPAVRERSAGSCEPTWLTILID